MKKSCLMLSAMLTIFIFANQAIYAQTDKEEFDKRYEETDMSDAEDVFEFASWAMKSKNSKVRKSGRKFMKEVIELDEDHEGARNKLGYVKVGEKWYTKKNAAKARRKEAEGRMKEKGYIWYKNGWIKKTLKRKWNNKWEKSDEDVWLSYEEVMSAKGFTQYKGQWLQITGDDKKRMDNHRKNTGEDVLITTTQHFVIHTNVPITFVKKYTELCEKVYDWYMKTFNVPDAQAAMIFGRRAHIWTFETQQQFQDWVTTYTEFYKFSDKDKKMFRDNPSGWLLTQKRILTLVSEQPENLENSLLHQLGVIIQRYNIQSAIPSWMSEAFGHLVEELFSGIKFGRVNMSTQAKYASGGGIADKEYNTKDGKPQTKGVVKSGDDVPMDELSKKTLNSLNKDNLAQGFSMTEWMFNHHRESYLKYINTMKSKRSGDGVGNVRNAIKGGMGMSTAEFERAWRKYVKATYR